MASITLKDIPEDLHAQLKVEAEANFRSLTQEALARIERSFLWDDQLSAATVNRLVQLAVDSGPEEPLSRAKFEAAGRRADARLAAKDKVQ
jgi:plasmid stability protein